MKFSHTEYQKFKTNLGYSVKLSKVSDGIYISGQGTTLMSICTFNRTYGYNLPLSETTRDLAKEDVVSITVPTEGTDTVYQRVKAFPLEELEKRV